MQKVEFEISAKDSGATSAWKRQEAAINGVIEQLGKLEAKQKQTAAQQENLFAKSISGAASMAAGYVSVQGSLNLVRKEWDAIE